MNIYLQDKKKSVSKQAEKCYQPTNSNHLQNKKLNNSLPYTPISIQTIN